MRMYTFYVEDANGHIHTETSTYKTLDIQDNRLHQVNNARRIAKAKGLQPPYQEPPYIDIHYSFLAELTRQISPQIQQIVGKELMDTFVQIGCDDNYFLHREDCFYIFIYLSGKSVSNYLWVKCCMKYDPQVLCQPVDKVTFQLCGDEEHRTCDMQKWGGSHQRVGLDYIKFVYTEIYKNSVPEAIPESDYPDVMLHIRMKALVNKAQKEQIHKQVMQFIEAWNENAVEQEQIHYAELYNNGGVDRYTILIHVDFGNCDPVALEKLFQFLINNNSDVKEITI